MALWLLLLALTSASQAADKQLVATITAQQLKGGLVSEITWDNGVLFLQGVFAEPSGELKAEYFVLPAERITIEKRAQQTDESLRYWRMKSNRLSPTGLGRIVSTTDTRMPQFGIGDLERRISEAYDMGGTQTKNMLRLGTLVLLEREGPEPYDGETWSWSPPELNRIAYVDAKGDLWTARADGTSASRLLRGDFTLPAWSPDGRTIAVAERKDSGKRWEIYVVHLPAIPNR